MHTEPRRVVVDASVAVKWFLPEVDSDLALQLLSGAFSLAAPDFLYIEFANVLWKRLRGGDISQEDADELLVSLCTLPVGVHPSLPLFLRAFEMACATGRTVYDSLYLALAVRDDAVLVTADESLFNAVCGTPLVPHIALLADFPGSAWARQSSDAQSRPASED